ncbi:acyl carrier protein [Amycolatopsis sp. Hca4]|uniref:acyl carrier protein n=1 Tax=Amycolatopsis sp. Hca4 TaxID=2742131 RepID=UPI0015906FAF|nr:acyl carrier protein [Amycolatopsis sp. Hca4]QKV74035.1 acyl carrier protein [Amycolatopsis sp. Hca4]
MSTRFDVVEVLTGQLARVLEIPPDRIRPEDQLAYLPNVDSLRLLDAIAGAEDALRTKVDEDDLVGVRTVAELAALFAGGGPLVTPPLLPRPPHDRDYVEG